MPTHPDRWAPRTRDDIAGNSEIKQFLWGQFGAIRFEEQHHGSNAMIIAPPGTGKSTAVRLFLMSLLCENLDQHLNPCHVPHCCGRDSLTGRCGLFAQESSVHVEVMTVNCADVHPDQLRRVREIADARSGPLVIWLDEVHRLARRNLDEELLVAMDTTEAMWLATSTTVGGPEPAFVDRFRLRLSTSPPTRNEFVGWLAARCVDCGVRVDNPTTLALIADDIGRNGRQGLAALSFAISLNNRLLTRSVAEDFLDRLTVPATH